MRPLAIATEDLRITLRDAGSLFWIFAAPVLWVYFFSFVSGAPDPSQTRVGLTVVDRDDSPLSERLAQGLARERFTVRVAAGGAPGAESSRGRTLTIPKGFADAVAARRKVVLELREGERANPEGTYAAQVALHRATVRLLANEAFGPSEPAADAVSVRASFAGRRKIPSGYYQTLPGNLVMFVLLVTISSGAALLARERERGLLRRLATSPASRAELIGGKLLGRVAVGGLQVAVFLALGLLLFRIDWGRSPVGLAAVLLSTVLCAAALSLLLGALIANPGAASGAGVILVLGMSALGGCWWPAEIMPQWLQSAARVLPTSWAMQGLHQLLSWGGGLPQVLLPCAVLLGFGLFAFAAAARLLDTR